MNIKTLSLASLSSLTLVFSLAATAGETMEKAEAAASDATAIEAQAIEMQTEAMVEAAPGMASEAKSDTEASAAEAVQAEAQEKAKPKKDFDEKVAEYNKDKDKDDKVVCRREKKTGSHFSRRRCVTAAQAEREREDAQEALQRASRGTNTGPVN